MIRAEGLFVRRGGRNILQGVSLEAGGGLTAVIGPKYLARLAVPRDWAMNRAINMPAEMGTMKGSSLPARPGASCRPSTADSTEMAGVMTPSP